GKTEIYLDLARRTLDDGRQVLFLIPEISLTPQFVQRVRDGLNYPVAVQHSGLSDRDRFRHWWRARSSEPVFVLGTRSAVFAPCPNLGLIIVDEEHDLSYKQADGFRYHARNLAIKRAELTQATVVLGSATPSLESYARAKDQNKQSHWHLHRLKQRYGSSTLPDVHLVDLNLHPSKDGLTEPLLANLRQTLNDGQQALVFVNRRGFAPVLHCVSCGWQSKCSRCDARMTLHQSRQQLRCHHCGRHIQSIEHCPDCNTRLLPIGAGTQRAVQGLQSAFPEARIIRLDRDNITSQDDLNLAMGDIRERRVDMIVGTQLISKGHDFPNVTLVAALNADQGLFGVDFRSSEQLFQQLVQVAGRAGRREVRGRVLIQSHYPQNALFEHIRQQDYTAFAASALEERQVLMFPPYSHMAIWRAESTDAEAARVFLLKVSELGQSLADENNFEACELFDVLPSPLERLAGRYRFQLPVKSRHRGNLHRWLQQWTRFVEGIKEGRRTRWSLDIDPMDMY
ncbi:MAG: primosomal protein N', partial [Pseudomonadota bacterium]